jgi:hypothetical protein
MELRSSLILGACVLLGFALHALLQPVAVRSPAPAAQPAANAAEVAHRHRLEEIEQESDVELDRALLERGQPRVIEIDGQELLYDPDWKRGSGGFTLTAKYYRLVDAKLVEVSVVRAGTDPR